MAGLVCGRASAGPWVSVRRPLLGRARAGRVKYALVAGKFEDNARRAAAMAGDHVVALVTDASPERDVLCLATMGFAFDQARCWLSRGRAQRRAKQRGAARRS